MARRLPPLNSLRAFEAASRLGSFQKAAAELNVTPSALSYQIRQLEDYLQVSLFERLNRAVELTEIGQRFAPGIQDGFERLEEAMTRLKPVSAPNILTVSTGPAFAAKWLAPRLYRFIEIYPDIEIRISASLKLLDFRTDDVDVAIRFGAGNYPGLYVEQLTDEAMTPMVSPALVARHGGKFDAEALKQTTLLHDDSAQFLKTAPNWADWLKRARIDHPAPERGLRFNHADHALDAAIDGAGAVMGRLTLAARDMKAGRIVAPFPLLIPPGAAFYFCCLPDAVEKPKVAAFRKFMMEQAAMEAGMISSFKAQQA